MEDRAKLNNGKSSKLVCPRDYTPTDFADFLQDLQGGLVYVDVNPNDSLDTNPGVSAVGTPLNTENLLSNTVASSFGLSGDDAIPTKVYEKILDRWTKADATYYATFSSSGWSNSAPYTQTVNVSGVLASWTHPIYDLYIPNGTSATNGALQADAFSLVNKMVTNNGSVTLYCYGNKPQTTFQIMLAKG